MRYANLDYNVSIAMGTFIDTRCCESIVSPLVTPYKEILFIELRIRNIA